MNPNPGPEADIAILPDVPPVAATYADTPQALWADRPKAGSAHPQGRHADKTARRRARRGGGAL